MIRSSLRRLAAQSPALALVVLGTLLSGALWTVPASAAEAETASIDHAQPADGAVRLLVTVPGTEAIDLDEVAVTIGGKDVATESDTASDSDDVQRTSILAIDTSNSMRGTRIAEAKKAAAAYLGAVPANVKVGVLTFDTDVEVVVPAGTDRDAAREAIAGLTLTQDTALYDGVLGALRAAGPNGATAGQRKVLLLSDGKDTTKTTLTSVVDAVKKSGVTVDVVSLQQGDEANAPLNAITAAGKGTMLNTADPTALSEAFAAEADDLARQIVV
ncbi:MAG TPA: vWA domain-containing protein, partial [Marmoricola sp.]|nr:vWA domain-containing protein [Marmoricola sp.]